MKKHFLSNFIFPILLLAMPLAAGAAKVEKDWNFIVYIAANNNLHRFSVHNIRQMAKVGSTENMNIVVQIGFILNINTT